MLDELEKPDDGQVGYCKPPKHTQFRPGISGNPKGRPKKTKNFNQKLLKEANSTMTVTENGERKRMSKHEVIIKQLMKQAMTGNHLALKTYLSLSQQAFGSVPQPTGTRLEDLKFKKADEMSDDELAMIAQGVFNEKDEN